MRTHLFPNNWINSVNFNLLFKYVKPRHQTQYIFCYTTSKTGNKFSNVINDNFSDDHDNCLDM